MFEIVLVIWRRRYCSFVEDFGTIRCLEGFENDHLTESQAHLRYHGNNRLTDNTVSLFRNAYIAAIWLW